MPLPVQSVLLPVLSPPSADPVTPAEAKNAVWGGLMTAGAIVRGAQGVVISGRCRDLAEHNSAQFPVFARGNSTLVSLFNSYTQQSIKRVYPW